MRHFALTAAAVALALAPLAAPAHAQDSATPGAVSPRPATQGGTQQIPLRVAVLPATELVGRPALDRLGNEAGTVDRILIDPQSGRVGQVLIDLDGGALVAVPWQAVDPVASRGERLSLFVAGDALRNAPRFDASRLSELTEPMVAAGIADHYAPLLKDGPDSPAPRLDSARPMLLIGRDMVSLLTPPAMMPTGQLQGTTVFAQGGDMLGEIDEVVIDPRRGQVAYLLLERGAVLGLGGDWVPLPIEALSWSSEPNRGFVLSADRSRLQEMPALEKGDALASVTTAALESLYDRFGTTPYWERGPASQTASEEPPQP